MDSSRIIYLYERFNNRTATSEEVHEFHASLAEPDSEQAIKSLIAEKWDALAQNQMTDLINERIDPVFNAIVAHKQTKKTKVSLWPRIAIAASLLIALSLGLLVNQGKLNFTTGHRNIAPGKNGATLTLANGTTIDLSTAVNGKFAEESGVTITKNEHGELIYQIAENIAATKDGLKEGSKDHSRENILSTAIGQTYQVRLPDGTKIWLNAASTLRYPTSFAAMHNRKVKLSGEAYFEVAHNKALPFIVETGKQVVEVVGTHFNINSYADEKAIETTLLEGAVLVDTLMETNGSKVEKGHGILLKPNEQAVFSAGHFHVHAVEAREFVSWKDGKFSFDRESLSSIMRKVARWYNVTIVYQDDIGDIKLTGSISRFEQVDTFLELLEKTKEVHFKIEGKKIIVMK